MRIIFWLSLVVFVVSTSLFAGLYLKRAAFYAQTEIVPASLGALYPVASNTLVITKLTPEPKAVKIDFNGNPGCRAWTIEIDGAPGGRLNGENPSLPLKSGPHDYALFPQDCTISSPAIEAVRLNMFFGAKETFGVQNISIDQIQLNSANLPVLMEPPEDFSRWVPDIESRTGPEAQFARQTLLDAGYDNTWPVRDRIAFIASLVRERMPGGTPDERLNSLTPFALFTEAQAGRAENFCRQWSLSYGYFANAVGIPTRNLFTGGAMGTVDLGSHAFSESYLADEARWVYVDPTNEIAFLQDRKGRLLSGADVYMAAISDNLDGLQARMTGPTVVMKPFREVSEGVVSFMHRENFLIYIGGFDGRYQMDAPNLMRYPYKIWRFIAQPQQYFGYTPFTSYFWLRPLSFFTALGSATLFALSALFLFRKKPRRR